MTILSKDIHTNLEEETFNLGKSMGRAITPGIVVGFKGELGTGKTIFIKGILAGLDYEPKNVASASFVLAQEYKAKIPVVHIDLYRLGDKTEIFDIDLNEYSSSNNIVLIEWAEKIEDILDLDIYIKINFLNKINQRSIEINTDNKKLLKRLHF